MRPLSYVYIIHDIDKMSSQSQISLKMAVCGGIVYRIEFTNILYDLCYNKSMQNIKSLKTIYQKDIFPNIEIIDVEFEDRLTGKAIIIDKENKIAMVGSSVNFIYTLPGGGIDIGEQIEQGIIREIKEEAGCIIEISHMLGRIDDYRNRDKKHCISYCAIAKVIGDKQEPELTEEEKKNGLHVKWFTKDEVYKILEDEYKKVLAGEINFYNTAYNVVRDFEFVKEYLGR